MRGRFFLRFLLLLEVHRMARLVYSYYGTERLCSSSQAKVAPSQVAFSPNRWKEGGKGQRRFPLPLSNACPP
jgi:hypothetical protein